ncbi:MAG: CPBP family glutamic-type intramembrane protease [Micrococcaceae bacterium]
MSESALFIVCATAASALVASPMLLGWLTGELSGLLVPAAQLTPFAVAAILFLAWRPERFTTVFALRWKGSWWGLGVGFSALIVISLLQLSLGLLLGWQLRPADAVVLALVAVIPFLLLQSAFAIGEEWGWRGWLVSRTQQLPIVGVCLISAVAWTVWHLPALPLILQDAPLEVGVAYLASIFSWAPALVVLRLLTGSVWPAVFVHGGLNSVRVFFLQSVADSGGVNWVVEALGWVLWLGAAALIWKRANTKRARDSARTRFSAV